jgi:hypothetical protein
MENEMRDETTTAQVFGRGTSKTTDFSLIRLLGWNCGVIMMDAFFSCRLFFLVLACTLMTLE